MGSSDFGFGSRRRRISTMTSTKCSALMAPTVALGVILGFGLFPAVTLGQAPVLDKAATKALRSIDQSRTHFEAAHQALGADDLKGAGRAMKKARKQLDKAVKVTQTERYLDLGESILASVRKMRRLLISAENSAKGGNAAQAKSFFDQAYVEFGQTEAAIRAALGESGAG